MRVAENNVNFLLELLGIIPLVYILWIYTGAWVSCVVHEVYVSRRRSKKTEIITTWNSVSGMRRK